MPDQCEEEEGSAAKREAEIEEAAAALQLLQLSPQLPGATQARRVKGGDGDDVNDDECRVCP